MGQVLLSECHPETGTLQSRVILHQRFQFFVVEQIRIPFSNVRISQILVNLQRSGFHPFTILIKTSVLSNLTDIDFRIKVGCKRFAVVASVAVHDIQIMDFIKIMLSRISRENCRHTRVEAASQNSSQALLLKAILISPLPAVFKMSLIFRFVVCSIQIIDTAFQTSVHDGQILIRQRYINYYFRLERAHQSYQILYFVRIHLSRLYPVTSDSSRYLVTF